MLPKKNRLRRARDFQAVFNSGKRLKTEHLEIIVAPARKPEPRAGFLIKAGLVRKSVARNFWKRKLREAGRKALAGLTGSHDMIVLLKKLPPKAAKTLLKEELRELINKVRKA